MVLPRPRWIQSGSGSWRFLVEPPWLASHLLVGLMVVAMVGLGLWQVHRLEGRRRINAMLAARMAESPVPVDRLISPTTPVAVADRQLDRRVEATGTFDAADQVVVGPETDADGNAAWWLATPLVLADGTVVVVNRGTIPYDAWSPNLAGPGSTRSARADAALAAYPPRRGPVTVSGLLAETQTRTEGLRDPATGALVDLHRLDLGRLADQLPGPVLPVVLDQQPPVADPSGPQPVPAPALGDGPHLTYAIQWFSFTAATVVLYPILLRRRSRRDLRPRQPSGVGSAERRAEARRRARAGVS